MEQIAKFAVIGIGLIIGGFLLNALAIWIIIQSTLLSYPGQYPPPMAPIAWTAFLYMVPVGMVILGYSGILAFKQYRIDIRKISSQ